MEWYYAKDGKQNGPVAFEEISRLAAQGLLTRADLVWKQGMPNWRPAGEIEGLFADVPSPPALALPALETPQTPSAGFWARAGAHVIDGLVLFTAGIAFVLLRPKGIGGFFLGLGIGLTISAAYYISMIAKFGQTLGKMAIGAIVVMDDGSPVTTKAAVLRWLGYMVDNYLTLGIGYLIVAFTDKKRGLHDYIAGTRVVYLPENRAALGVVIGASTVGIFPLLGVLAAIAIPNFARMADKAKEGATKASIGVLRSSLAIYRGDNNGAYPSDLGQLTQGGKYLAAVPLVQVKGHAPTHEVQIYGNEVCIPTGPQGRPTIDGSKLHDSGSWGYVADRNSPCWGDLFVDCTHPDSSGKAWFSY